MPLAPVAAQPVIATGAMLLEEQKMLRVFLRLSPMRFSGAIVDDTHKFLTTCRELLSTLDLVELSGANFIAYQLDKPAR